MTKAWHPQSVSRLEGRTALVTGANSGLGLQTAIALAAAGAHVVITCRGEAKLAQAQAAIERVVPAADLALLDLDLASLDSVRVAAQRFLETGRALDILCNNAGVMGLPLMRTRDGFEMLFGVNHLGHFALTGHLLEALQAATAARIITVASLAALKGTLPMDDLNWERRPYSRAGAYAQAKLANLCFALELNRRLQAGGSRAISVAAHPGYAATNVVFARDAKMTFGRRLWSLLARTGNAIVAQSAERGAWPSIYAATMPQVNGGDYIGPHGLFQFRGYPVRVTLPRQATDAELCRRLWARSVELTGVNYP